MGEEVYGMVGGNGEASEAGALFGFPVSHIRNLCWRFFFFFFAVINIFRIRHTKCKVSYLLLI